ncbi:MAG: chorismate synthase [Lachnospiraceae bacterium]|nr:chorismate synthase [Lachnospiraceae bacterium]
MSFTIGEKIRVTVFGQSHADAVGVVIDGLPAGEEIDTDRINSFLKRRAGGQASYTTARKESDEPRILAGLSGGRLCGAPLTAVFENANKRPADYGNLRSIPRPSHADYTAFLKYNGKADMSGGGHFSARLTLPMCFAGAVMIQLLERRGIDIGAHILRIGEESDRSYDPVSNLPEKNAEGSVPVLDPEAGKRMTALMEKTASEGDSVGGIVECKVTGFPAGIGDPIYDSLESRISHGIFGIPAVKGIEFGIGFLAAQSLGSRINDSFVIREGKVLCETNNSGGIQGGISNGMPILFRTAFKPTPSIYKEQRSVDLETMKEVPLKIEGRHDSCIVPRAVPCVEAMCAIILYDELMKNG